MATNAGGGINGGWINSEGFVCARPVAFLLPAIAGGT
jgi:hypothetical protein